MKTLVFGKNGQLARAFLSAPHDPNTIFIGREECDLSNRHAILDCLAQNKPDQIINAAAYTAVDRAEEEKELAFAVNTLATRAMAEYCAANQRRLIYFSTDYVFDGEKQSPYFESDLCRPLNVYGKSKYAGELAIIEAYRAHQSPSVSSLMSFYILRTSWVYGDGANFIRTILRLARERTELKVVVDQFGVPTNADWLVKISEMILRAPHLESGIYHTVPAGRTSWYELARFVVEYAKSLGISFTLNAEHILPIPARDYPLPAKRPMNSSLSTHKLADALPASLNLICEDWKMGVMAYISNLKARNLL